MPCKEAYPLDPLRAQLLFLGRQQQAYKSACPATLFACCSGCVLLLKTHNECVQALKLPAFPLRALLQALPQAPPRSAALQLVSQILHLH